MTEKLVVKIDPEWNSPFQRDSRYLMIVNLNQFQSFAFKCVEWISI
jgi:hypothetical protein